MVEDQHELSVGRPSASLSLASRRSFLQVSANAGAACFATALPSWMQAAGADKKSLCFGVIADVHKDIIHDADERLSKFVDYMKKKEVDFIIQLGDFCIPKEENQGFLDIWNAFPGPRYHVLGNHDTDGGFQREQTVAWWEMEARYYSFDQGDTHFVVLDGNDRPADHKRGYPKYIAQDQLDWLRADLEETELPTVVFVHQSLERENLCVINGAEVREVLENVNREAGRRKVIACFSGHHHRDYVREINGILYPQINSASYHWVGREHQRQRYSDEIHQKYPALKNTVPYKDALFALVTLDYNNGSMGVEGKKSAFVGPTPWQSDDDGIWDAATLAPEISDWERTI